MPNLGDRFTFFTPTKTSPTLIPTTPKTLNWFKTTSVHLTTWHLINMKQRLRVRSSRVCYSQNFKPPVFEHTDWFQSEIFSSTSNLNFSIFRLFHFSKISAQIFRFVEHEITNLSYRPEHYITLHYIHYTFTKIIACISRTEHYITLHYIHYTLLW